MVAAGLTFLTPTGAVLALAVALPLLGLFVAERHVDVLRRRLGLRAPHGVRETTTLVALAAVPALLALAAMQPALRSRAGARMRTDAEAVFVLDTSRSMLAAPSPTAPTRLQRAQAAAVQLRAAIPGVPAGVSTFTDRVLPDLLPIPDVAAFDSTVRDAVGIERPPPEQTDVTVTTFARLADVATQGFFTPSARHRLLVVLTDGESRPDASPSHLLRRGRVRLVLVHVWRPGERVFRPNGRVEGAYRPDANSTAAVEQLASASGGRAFAEGELRAAGAAERTALGSGPTALRGLQPKTRPLAPFVAAAAVLPLLLILRRKNLD